MFTPKWQLCFSLNILVFTSANEIQDQSGWVLLTQVYRFNGTLEEVVPRLLHDPTCAWTKPALLTLALQLWLSL